MFEVMVAGFALMVCYAIYGTISSTGFSIHPNEDEKKAREYHQKGKDTYTAGDHQAALEAYTEGLEIAPRNLHLLYARSHLLYELKKYDAAIVDCSTVLDMERNDYPMRLRRGYCYLYIGKLGEGLHDFDYLILYQPDNPNAYVGRLEIYKKMKEYDKALGDANFLKASHPDGWLGYYYTAAIYYEAGKFKEAIQEATKTLELDDIPPVTHSGLLWMRSWSHYNLRRYDTGTTDAKLLLGIAPEQHSSHYCYGYGLSRQGLHEEALPHLEKAHELKPDSSDVNFYLAHTLLRLKRFDEAENHFNMYIESMPDNVNGYLNRGQAYAQLQQHDKAIADYSKVIELDTAYALAYNNRSWSKAPLGDYQGALDDANKAIELDAEQAYFYSTRGQALWLLKDYEAALTDYAHALHLNPDEIGYVAEGAVALFSLGRNDEAIAMWRQVQARDDDLTTAEKLQEYFRWAEPFYRAMCDVENASTND